MPIDLGTGVIVVATLVFYLRLIILQRQKLKQQTASSSGKRNKKAVAAQPQQFSIISRNRRDWIIAGAGFLIVILGVLLKAGVLPLPGIAPYWWAPVALGILACNWGFQ